MQLLQLLLVHMHGARERERGGKREEEIEWGGKGAEGEERAKKSEIGRMTDSDNDGEGEGGGGGGGGGERERERKRERERERGGPMHVRELDMARGKGRRTLGPRRERERVSE